MPVGMEFSIARRKLVSVSSACCTDMRRRVWRQVTISIDTVSTLSAHTSQNRPLPITPSEVRQAWARKIRPLPTGDTGTSKALIWVAQGSNCAALGRTGMLLPASTWPLASSRATAYLVQMSDSTPNCRMLSVEYSASSSPPTLPWRASGRCSSSMGTWLGVAIGCEYTGCCTS